MSVRNGKPDWRTQETFDAYAAERTRRAEEPSKKCYLCEDVIIQDFVYWQIIPNTFPYDRVTDKHDLLLLKRHSDGDDITEEEKKELEDLKKGILGQSYGFIMQTLGTTTSIPSHLHYHLIQPKGFE